MFSTQRLFLSGLQTALLAGMAIIANGEDLSKAIGVSARGGNEPELIVIDGRSSGKRFDGLGGVSAGASSRLLYDYPEPARSEILDYLFKPKYGAGTQILKVEIGGDMNSTCGSEASHERIAGEVHCDKGYEWWLMEEAKRRNPEIVFAALQWGAPDWFEGGFWSHDNVDYIMSWLDCAKENGFDVKYVGGWNESGYEAEWFVKLAKALKEHHASVGIIAADDLPHHNWRIAESMATNLGVSSAIDVLGQHSPGGWRGLYARYSAPAAAHQFGKPLWVSEQSAMSHDAGGRAWARGINRAYVDAKITASLNWAPVSSWYSILPHADTGLVLAEWPWSGYYVVGSTLWATAHTTQFAEPGWHYVDSACGYLDSGASYVTLKSPDGGDYSVVIETLDASEPTRVQFEVSGGLSSSAVHVWSSNMGTVDIQDDFIHQELIVPEKNAFEVKLKPGYLYSLTTTAGQQKGNAGPESDVWEQMELPYREDFEGYHPGQLARYFSDLNGGFETAPAANGRMGMAYRQMVPGQPIVWNLAGAGSMVPTTMLGDPRWWGDYELSADVLLDQPGYVELIGRCSSQAGKRIAGYHLRVNSDGNWVLYSQEPEGVRKNDIELASGVVPFDVGKWHRVGLRMEGNRIDVIINGVLAGTFSAYNHLAGNVALQVGPWQYAQIDNVEIMPTGSAPQFVSQEPMEVSATSEHPWFRGDIFPGPFAADGRPESFWHSERKVNAKLPQSLTLELGGEHEVEALVYQPRIDGVASGIVTGYNVYLSTDGKSFEKVATGNWPVSTSSKVASWPRQSARYVRFEAVRGVNGVAAAGEVNVASVLVPE